MPGGGSAASATPITPLPFTDNSTPAAWNDQFWYVYTPASDHIIGLRPTVSGNFDPVIDTFYDLASLFDYMGSFTSWGSVQRPVVVPVQSGVPLYFSVRGVSNPGAITGTVTLSAYLIDLEDTAVPVGALIIPDDTAWEYPDSSGFFVPHPLSIFSAVNGDPIRQVRNIVAGEAGFILETGEMLLEDRFQTPEGFVLYDVLANFAILATPANQATTTAGIGSLIGPWGASAFVVTIHDTTISRTRLWKVSAVGAISDLQQLPVGHSVRGGGLDAVAGIFYYANATADTAIRRWDVVNEIALSDLVAGQGSGYAIVRDSIKVLADGTILAGYRRSSPRDNVVKQFDASGTLLNTYQLDTTGFDLDRIQLAIDDPDSFWAWLHFTEDSLNEKSRFQNIAIIDGAVLTTFDLYQFNQGVGPDLTVPPEVGHSFSCPLLILPVSVSGTAVVGTIGPLVWVHWPRLVPDAVPGGSP